MRYLRTNTACRVTVGPFFDKTDGITPEVSLTVTNCKLTLMVDDGNVPTLVLDAAATASAGSNDMVHVTNDDAGFYDLELAAANVNYLGRAMLAITDAANHCPVFHEFMIIPAVVYDAMILGTDLMDVSMTQILGTAVSAPATAGILDVNVKNMNNVAATSITAINANQGTTQPINFTGTGATAYAKTDMVDILGTAVSSPATAGILDVNVKNIANAAVSTTAAQIGVNVVQISADATAADNAESFFDGTGYAGTNNVIPTVTAVTNAVTANVTQISGDSVAADNLEAACDGTTYNIGGGAVVAASVTGAVGSVTGAVGSVTGNVGGNVAGSVASVTGAVGSVTGNVGGNVAGSVASVTGAVGSVAANGITATSIAADAINAASLKTDAVTKIQNGLATPTNITAGTITTVTNLTNAPTNGDLTATMKTSVTTAATAATPTISTLGANTITAASIATGAITNAKFASGAIDAAAIATDAIGADEIAAGAVTKIQTGLATPTNITAGTITTVTNLTNAPTNGDLTATMKASVNAEVDTALNTAIPGSPTTGSINERIDAKISSISGGSGLDAAGVRAAIGLASANLDTQLADIPTVAEMNARTIVAANYALDSTVAKSAELDKVPKSDGSASWNATALTAFKTQAGLALSTGTISELSTGIPPVTPTYAEAIMLPYMALRNVTTETAATGVVEIANDAGTTICKSTITDDGSTLIKTKLAAG